LFFGILFIYYADVKLLINVGGTPRSSESASRILPPKSLLILKGINILIIKGKHYPPGTQENYNSFPSRNIILEKGKELECSRRAGGLMTGGGSPY